MKKLLLTLVDGEEHEKLHLLSGPTHKHFADRQGYDYTVGRVDPTVDRPASWHKIKLMRSALGIYDRVFFIDNDALFLRFDIDPMDLLDQTTAFCMLAEEDKEVVNCGIWWIKNTGRALRFLDEVWEQEDLINHMIWEQAAVHRMLGSDGNPRFEYMRFMVFCTQFFNDCYGREDHPVVRHYCGIKNRIRAIAMEQDLRNYLGWQV